MILSVTLNPCVDHTLFLDSLKSHDRNRIVRTETDAGGKGVNLSRIVAELGGPTIATGFLGGDAGRYVAATLARQGVENDFVEIAGETRTNFSVEAGDGPPTTFNADGPMVNPNEWESLLDHVASHCQGAAWVAMGGSIPPGISADAYARLGERARGCGTLWALDADGTALKAGLEARPDFVKPNRDEIGRFLGREVAEVSKAVRASRELRDRFGCVTVVSMGAEGAVLSCPAGEFVGEPLNVPVRSTIGSGDSLIGGMLWSRSQGAPWEEAFRWGLAAGAATAMSDGSSIGSRADAVSLHERAVVKVA